MRSLSVEVSKIGLPGVLHRQQMPEFLIGRAVLPAKGVRSNPHEPEGCSNR